MSKDISVMVDPLGIGVLILGIITVSGVIGRNGWTRVAFDDQGIACGISVPTSPFCTFRLCEAYEESNHQEFFEHVGEEERKLRNYYKTMVRLEDLCEFFCFRRQTPLFKSMVFYFQNIFSQFQQISNAIIPTKDQQTHPIINSTYFLQFFAVLIEKWRKQYVLQDRPFPNRFLVQIIQLEFLILHQFLSQFIPPQVTIRAFKRIIPKIVPRCLSLSYIIWKLASIFNGILR